MAKRVGAHTTKAPARGGSAGHSTLSLALVVAVWASWPLVLHLSDHVAGLRGDQCLYIWSLDTVARNVLAGRWPFWTDRIFYPVGYNLALSPTGVLWLPLALPFLSHLPWVHNVITLAVLAGAVLAVATLVRTLHGPEYLGVGLGSLYALGPVRAEVVDSHSVTAVGIALLPLVLVMMLRAAARPSWPRVLQSVAGVGLLFSIYPYYGWVAVLVSSGVWLRHVRLATRLVPVFAGVGVALAMLARHLDPVRLGRLWHVGNMDGHDFLVMAAPFLLLAIAGWRAWSWWVGIAACVALALGGNFRVGKMVYWEPSWMPWPWLAQHSTVWGLMDIPRHFTVGIVAGGLPVIVAGAARWPRLVPGLVGLVLAAFLMAMPPMPLYALSASVLPPVYQPLVSRPLGVLLELPGGIMESKTGSLGANKGGYNANAADYFQVLHQHRRVGGYVARVPIATFQALATYPVLGDLLARTSYDRTWQGKVVTRVPTYDEETVTTFLRRLHLRYILLAPNDPELAGEVRAMLAGHVRRSWTFGSETLLQVTARKVP